MSPAIFDRVQSPMFAIKTKILLFMHNGLESYLVLLTWRFCFSCIILEKFIIPVVFLHEIIIFGIEFEFPEVWISCSVSPFVESCANGRLILILLVVLFWNIDLISNIIFFCQIKLLIQFIISNLLHMFEWWSHYGVALFFLILLDVELDVLSRHIF